MKLGYTVASIHKDNVYDTDWIITSTTFSGFAYMDNTTWIANS